ncbi:hypothetical protein [Tepidiforma sp.]|uniref:hypothetical protein n=1 Tax=Tepidiforma sp. TaxID=2682230 RepID=UPI002ADE2162|nr:hypothetical protein [Tepidiforma sp.]
MTARPRQEPLRVATRLATWADYGIAVALTVRRWLPLPANRPAHAFEPALVPAVAGARRYRPSWHEPVPHIQPWYVRPLEVVMLCLSFFLAAHLVGGGTPEARAPQISIAFLPSVPSAAAASPSQVIEVRPTAAAAGTPAAAPAVAASPDAEPAPAQAPRTADAAASDVHEAAAPSEPPAAASAPAETPAAEAAPPPPPPAVAPPVAKAAPLTYAQVIALAIEAGWPAELADAVARVAWCESRFRPDAEGYGTYGLMQVVPLWLEYAGFSFEQWSDPLVNLKAALAAFRYSETSGHAPWSAWSCKPDAITIP